VQPLVRMPAETRRIYLTFDDGPDPQWTPRILEVLSRSGVQATFFVIGRAARECPAVVRRVAEAGHEIENHGWSHRHPWVLSSRAARSEVWDGAAAIADLVGRAPIYFRPPHGRLRRCMTEAALEGGQQVALWSLSALDWGPLGYAAGIEQRLRRARAGDIILMHDGGRGNRPAALERVLPGFLRAATECALRASALGSPALDGLRTCRTDAASKVDAARAMGSTWGAGEPRSDKKPLS
jgi:peptidoglycan/xylan/chitin deacetylase (PgdA/CDA1 family)